MYRTTDVFSFFENRRDDTSFEYTHTYTLTQYARNMFLIFFGTVKQHQRECVFSQAKLPATLEVARESEMSSSLFGASMAAGIAATIAAAAVTLIIARRHAKNRAKLAGLATPDPEASKDYQDLCRARMQAKQTGERAESPRISSLSHENESTNLLSNRSSTSSWSEEPAFSNMDISTGHMVLVSRIIDPSIGIDRETDRDYTR